MACVPPALTLQRWPAFRLFIAQGRLVPHLGQQVPFGDFVWKHSSHGSVLSRHAAVGFYFWCGELSPSFSLSSHQLIPHSLPGFLQSPSSAGTGNDPGDKQEPLLILFSCLKCHASQYAAGCPFFLAACCRSQCLCYRQEARVISLPSKM